MYIAIDTTTETAGIALLHADGAPQAELTWHAGRNHTAELHTAVENLLRQARVTPADLMGIVVARGPGSFTGIRIGIATAKGLALGLGIPIVGVETLAVAAQAFTWTGRTVWSVVDAGRGQLAVAAYRRPRPENALPDFPEKVVVESIRRPDELPALIREQEGASLLTGEFPDELGDRVRAEVGPDVWVPPAAHRIRRAGHLAQLGWMRLSRGDGDDVVALEPLYLRPPAAVERAGGG